MKFASENKLLLSVILGLFMVALVVMIFTTARNTPAMARFQDKPYYDIPKAATPGYALPLVERLDLRSKTGFIDPIYTERLKEQRDGVPSPADILRTKGLIPGVNSPVAGAPSIPGYGKAPKSPFDVMYDEDSPFDWSGQPGRLGEKMKKYMNPDEKRKIETGIIETPTEEPVETPADLSKFQRDNPTQEDLRSSMLKILNAIIEAGKQIPEKPATPVEGKVDEESEDSN